jgi:hypothetical protein
MADGLAAGAPRALSALLYWDTGEGDGMRRERRETVRQPYGRYHQRRVPAEDAELTHVGPDTPAGEYLRRF